MMEQALQKYSRVIALGLIAIFSLLLAMGANELIAIQLAPFTVPDLPETVTEKQPTKRPTATPTSNFKHAIADRCFFGCPDEVDPNVCEEECAEGEVCQSGKCVAVEPSEEVSSDFATLSDLNVKLIGCMVAKKPEYSLALVTETAANATFIVGVGDSLLEAEVVEIRRDRVILKRNGRLEYISIVDALAGAPAPSSSPLINRPASTNTTKPQQLSPSIAAAAELIEKEEAMAKEGVRSLGNNRYEIDRAAINEQLANPEVLAKQAQIVPNYTKDGKNSGIKLIGIQPSSVYSKIGIKNGDVIMGIGGEKIDSQAKALKLLDGMRSQSNVKIEIERQGRTQSIEYSVK